MKEDKVWTRQKSNLPTVRLNVHYPCCNARGYFTRLVDVPVQGYIRHCPNRHCQHAWHVKITLLSKEDGYRVDMIEWENAVRW